MAPWCACDRLWLQEYLQEDACRHNDGGCKARVSGLMPAALQWLDEVVTAGNICGAEDMCGSSKPAASQVSHAQP